MASPAPKEPKRTGGIWYLGKDSTRRRASAPNIVDRPESSVHDGDWRDHYYNYKHGDALKIALGGSSAISGPDDSNASENEQAKSEVPGKSDGGRDWRISPGTETDRVKIK